MLDNGSGADAGLTPRELTRREVTPTELTAREMTRRQMIRRLVSGAGAGAVFAGTAVAHPIYRHLAEGALLAEADPHVPEGAWTPKYLDAHQSESLLLLAERLVPNSSKAQVNRFIDLLLNVDSAETQQKFSNSLAVFDRESISRFGHAFKDIGEARQDELLAAFSAETPSRESRGLGRSEEDAPAKKPSAETQLTHRDHFENVKMWVTGAYYSSEIGMRELGWTGVHFFQGFPGCEHPEGHS